MKAKEIKRHHYAILVLEDKIHEYNKWIFDILYHHKTSNKTTQELYVSAQRKAIKEFRQAIRVLKNDQKMAKPIKSIPVLTGKAARDFLNSIDKCFNRKLSAAEKAKRKRQNIQARANLKAILNKAKI